MGRLDAALVQAPKLDVTALLARARIAAPRELPRPGRPRVPLGRIAVLAAAAALAGVLVLGDSEPPLPVGADLPSPRPAAPPPLVEPAADQNVAVIPTRNPDITIVWIFQGD